MSLSRSLRTLFGGGVSAPASVIPTFFCSVCQERHPVDEEGVVRLTECGHLLCAESFHGFLLARLGERRTVLQCFATCNQLEPATPVAAEEAAAEASSAAASPAAATWACTHCTFVNSNPGAVECEICVMPRQPGAAAAASGRRRAGYGEGREERLSRLMAMARQAAPSTQRSPDGLHDVYFAIRRGVDSGQDTPRIHALLDSKRTCSAPISREDVRRALSSDPTALQRYNKILELALPGRVECPSCGAVQLGSPDTPAMACSACKAAFCFTHGLAHARSGGTCATFDMEHAQETRLTQEKLSKECRPCPKCKSPTFKYEGCNHMTCRINNCTCEWCWLCGKDITGNVSAHFHEVCRQFGDSRQAPEGGGQQRVERLPPDGYPRQTPWAALADLFLQGACCRAHSRSRAAEKISQYTAGAFEEVHVLKWELWSRSRLGAAARALFITPLAAVGLAYALAFAVCVYASYICLALPLGFLLAVLRRGVGVRLADCTAASLALASALHLAISALFVLLAVPFNLDTLLLMLVHAATKRLGLWESDDPMFMPMFVTVFAFMGATFVTGAIKTDEFARWDGNYRRALCG